MLGESLLKEFVGKPPYLERDLRALKPVHVLSQAKEIGIAPIVGLLEIGNISDLDQFSEIILSDDEIGQHLREKYFPDKKVIFDNTFLRWNNVRAISQDVPVADLIISNSELDKVMMSRAEEKAQRSPDWWRQVGGIIVKNGTVLLEGYNTHLPSTHSSYIDGDPRSSFNAGERIDLSLALHGEARMIAEAAKRGIPLEGSLLYVTTFPCPNCARMVANAGIKKVYFKEGYSLLEASRILKESGIQLIKVD